MDRAMITDVGIYFTDGCGRCDRFATDTCVTKIWAQGLAELRALCLAAGLEETAKWGHPCYMFAGRNLVLIGAFKGDFRLTFFNAALMTDPMGILEKQGANSQNPDMIRFTSFASVASKSALVATYLLEAMEYSKPIVSTNCEGPSEILDHGVDALLAAVNSAEDLAEKLAYFVDNPEKAKNCAKEAYTKLCLKYDIKIVSKQLRNFISQLK